MLSMVAQIEVQEVQCVQADGMLALRRDAKNLIEETEGCLGHAILIHKDESIVNQRTDVFMTMACVDMDVEELSWGVPLTKP
jgi:hypothetical protein